MGAEEELEEILLPPGARPEPVRPPYHPDPRPVFRGVRIVYGELKSAGFKLLYGIVDNLRVRVGSALRCLFGQSERALVELRIPRQMPHSYGPDVKVGGMLEIEPVDIRHPVVIGQL